MTPRGVACRQVTPGSTSLLLTSHAAEESESGPEGGGGLGAGGCVLPGELPNDPNLHLCVCVRGEYVCVGECVNSNY